MDEEEEYYAETDAFVISPAAQCRVRNRQVSRSSSLTLGAGGLTAVGVACLQARKAREANAMREAERVSVLLA